MATWRAPNDPSVYGMLHFDFSAGRAYLQELNHNGGPKITVTHLAAKAVALTLQRYPELNTLIRWQRLYQRPSVDIFLQVAIDDASEIARPDLSGAKIVGCDEKTLPEIAQELRDKSQAIRARQDPQFRQTLRWLRFIPGLLLRPFLYCLSWLAHSLPLALPGLPRDPFGSAMVTSVGMLGVPSGFAPLVPISRTGLIVCVGEVKDRPWVVEKQVVVRPILDISFTFDHRLMDGLMGSKMAGYLREILENPTQHLH